MYKASKFIKSITTSSGKAIALEYVSKTDVWERPILAQSVKDDFIQVAEKYKDTLKPDTAVVAMKEAEHPSRNDPTQHYSAFELDKNGKVIASNHYYK